MNSNKKVYAQEILNLLKQHYPQAGMILKWENNLELLIAIILSSQCTDTMVNKVTTNLFPKYRNPRNEFQNIYQRYSLLSISKAQIIELVNFAMVPLRELEQDIKSTGFYHNKAKYLQKASQIILDTYRGVLPTTITDLIKIPGVGRKTANVFLGNAYHLYEGIAVDTHVKKQARALRLTTEVNVNKIEQDLMQLYDTKEWFPLTYLLIEHGRNMRRSKTSRVTCHNTECFLCKIIYEK
jgi:endonuclease-3